MNYQGAHDMRMTLHAIQKLTKLMIILLVQDMINFLNMFPSKNGISSNLCLAAIILRSPNLEYNKLRIKFVANAQVLIGPQKTPNREH